MFKSFSCDSIDGANGYCSIGSLSITSNRRQPQSMPKYLYHHQTTSKLNVKKETETVFRLFAKNHSSNSQSLIDLSKLNCLPRSAAAYVVVDNKNERSTKFNSVELQSSRFDRRTSSKLPPIGDRRRLNQNRRRQRYSCPQDKNSESSEVYCPDAATANSQSTVPKAKRQNLKSSKMEPAIGTSSNRTTKNLLVSRFENDDYDYLINCTDLIMTCQEALQENNHFDGTVAVDDCGLTDHHLNLSHSPHHHNHHLLDGSMNLHSHHQSEIQKQSFDENISVRSPSSAASSGLGLSLEEDSSLKYCHSDEEFSSLNSATTESNHHHHLGSISPICPNSSCSPTSSSPVCLETLPTCSTISSSTSSCASSSSSYSVKTLFAEFIEWLDYIEDKLESTCYCAKIDLNHASSSLVYNHNTKNEALSNSSSIYSSHKSLDLLTCANLIDDDNVESVLNFANLKIANANTGVATATFKNDPDSQDRIGNVIKSVMFDNEAEDDPDLVSDNDDNDNEDKEHYFHKYQPPPPPPPHHVGLATLFGSKMKNKNKKKSFDQEEADREAEEWLMSLPPNTSADLEQEDEEEEEEEEDCSSDWSAIFAAHKALQNEIEKVSNRFLKEIRELTRQPEDDCCSQTSGEPPTVSHSSSMQNKGGLASELCQQEERCKRLWLTSLEYLIILEGKFGQRCPRHFNLNHGNIDDEIDESDDSLPESTKSECFNQLTPTNNNNSDNLYQQTLPSTTCFNESSSLSDNSSSSVLLSRTVDNRRLNKSPKYQDNPNNNPTNFGNNQLLSRSYNSIFSSAKYTKLFRLFNRYNNSNDSNKSNAKTGVSAISTFFTKNTVSNSTAVKSTIELRSTGIGDSLVTSANRRSQTQQQQQPEEQKQQRQNRRLKSGRTMLDQEPITDTHSPDGSGSPGADSGVFSSSTEKYEIIQKDIGYSSDADMSDAIEVHPHSSDQLISQRSARKNKVRRRRTRTNRPRPWSYHADWTDWDYYQTPFSANGENASQEDMLGYDNEHVVRRLTEFGENYETWINTDLALDADDLKAAFKPPVVIEKPEIESQCESPVITRRASYQDACTSPIPLFIEQEVLPSTTSTTSVVSTTTHNHHQNDNRFTQTKSKKMVDFACMAAGGATGVSVDTQTKSASLTSKSTSTLPVTRSSSSSSCSSIKSNGCCKNCSRQVSKNTSSSSSNGNFSSFKFYSSLAIAGLFAIFFAVTQFSPEIHKTYSRPPPL